MRKVIYAADLFCGAGGTSTGLLRAAKNVGVNVRLLAVNHWKVAIKTHSANHANAHHLATGLENVTPRDVVPGGARGKLDLLWASPSCTHHSVARGGRPCSNQLRAQPMLILDWLEQVYVKRLLIENVPEFVNWGPLGADGKPLKSKRGVLFENFLRSLKAHGYRFEWKILCCADYGDVTTRARFFLQAVRGRGQIRWPEPTHAKDPGQHFRLRDRWLATRDIIDWSISGQSIFRRKKPLAANTLRRIEAGIRKYWGAWAEPFLIMLRGTAGAYSLNSPLPSITAGGQHLALVEPFLSVMNNWPSQQEGYSIDRPLPSQTTANHVGVVEPFLTTIAHGNPDGNFSRRTHSLDDPCSTLTGTNDKALVEAFIIPQHSGGDVRSIDQPVPTITTISRHALVEPFLTAIGQTGGGDRVRGIGEPVSALVSKQEQCLVEPFITTAGGAEGPGRRPHSIDEPLGTILAHDRHALVEPFLVVFNGMSGAQSLGEPLATITAKDRFGVVQQYGLDILFRMLQPHELARAHSFPEDYKFHGTKSDVVKQIGNSVPVRTAQALCEAALTA